MDYSLEVQRRFHSPDNIGEYAPEAPGIVTGEAEDRTLNVWVRIQAQVDGTVIRSVRYQVFGCPHTVAAAGWVAATLPGRATDALRELDMHELREILDAPVEKLGRLLVLEDALQACWQAHVEHENGQKGS